MLQSPSLGLFNEWQSWMAVRWFFHQTDERRIKAHSLGSAAPLQKEGGLNSFGLATILINNSIPHSHTVKERERDGQTGWPQGGRERKYLHCSVARLCFPSQYFCNIKPLQTDFFLFYFFFYIHHHLVSQGSGFLPAVLYLCPNLPCTVVRWAVHQCVLWFSKAVGLRRTFPWIKRMISLASTGVRFQSRD